jgi:hypothetical protein
MDIPDIGRHAAKILGRRIFGRLITYIGDITNRHYYSELVRRGQNVETVVTEFSDNLTLRW